MTRNHFNKGDLCHVQYTIKQRAERNFVLLSATARDNSHLVAIIPQNYSDEKDNIILKLSDGQLAAFTAGFEAGLPKYLSNVLHPETVEA